MFEFLKRWFGRTDAPAASTMVAPVPAARIPVPHDPEAKLDQPLLGASHRPSITSWAYQLQDIEPAAIADLDCDLAVVDYAADGSAETAFTRADVAAMQARPGRARKRIVAYMSIGEAESYRFYWHPEWIRKDRKPAWLEHENPDWEENYKVRFWELAWQHLIFGSPHAYLDRIMAAGFDGAYLDIVDAFEYYEQQRPTARQEMIDFVVALTQYARTKRPGFMIIPQNGEALLESPAYRSVISAIGKEDLYFGLDDDEKANPPDETQAALKWLALARQDGIPVLVVEYLDDKAKTARVRSELARLGYAACFAPRDLDGLRPPPTALA